MASALRIVLVLLRIYTILIFVWALMTWIPGLSGSAVHNIVGWPIVPLLNVFSFASVGFIGLQAVILLAIVYGLEVLVVRTLKKLEPPAPPAPRQD